MEEECARLGAAFRAALESCDEMEREETGRAPSGLLLSTADTSKRSARCDT